MQPPAPACTGGRRTGHTRPAQAGKQTGKQTGSAFRSACRDCCQAASRQESQFSWLVATQAPAACLHGIRLPCIRTDPFHGADRVQLLACCLGGLPSGAAGSQTSCPLLLSQVPDPCLLPLLVLPLCLPQPAAATVLLLRPATSCSCGPAAGCPCCCRLRLRPPLTARRGRPRHLLHPAAACTP